MRFTNEQNIGLSMSVFLAHDDYDYDPRPNAMSATGLLKSNRMAVLSQRVEQKLTTMDISQLASSSLGSAVHDGIEKAWLNKNYVRALLKLGYSKKIIDRIVVNHGYVEDSQGKLVKDPQASPLPADAIPVYVEIRTEKEVDGFVITGKFDFVGDGELEDHKTTGTFTYMNDKTKEYRLQGSIYRWLNPDIITSDRMLINFTFTDWSKLKSITDKAKGYPPHKMMSIPITLMPIEETEKWVKGRIQELKANFLKKEEDLPLCTREELWQDPTVYKYYRDPSSKTRSTKNFDNFAEAQQRLMKDGSVGVIDIVPGKAKRCLYCSAAPICSQAKQMVLDGILDMEI